jgi:hypothetical protein
MVRSVHGVAMYTQVHISYNIFNMQETTVSGSPFESQVPDTTTCAVFTKMFRFQIIVILESLRFKNIEVGIL